MGRKSFSICVTSDVHGYVTSGNYRDSKEENHGLAKVASIIKTLRQTNEMILLDNGDFIQGSPLTYHHATFNKTKANPLIKAANALNYHALTLGNHEFNYGLDYLKNLKSQSDFPWLAANIIDKKTGKPYFGKPYIIKEMNGVRVGIIGVTTKYIPNWEHPTNIEGLEFRDAVIATREWVEKIKKEEDPDFLVVMYHGGVECDLETSKPSEPLTGENQAYQICQEVEGIDVLVTGHQHRFFTTTINEIPVIQTGKQGQALGEIKITIDQNKAKKIALKLHSVTEDTKEDPDILSLVEVDEKETQRWLDQAIGEVEGDMLITDAFEARLKEHPFIEFINRVQMETAGVDISNTALFDNHAPGFKNKITMRDIVTNYIYPNTLRVIRISGQDMMDALEQNASYFDLNDKGEVIIHPSFCDPKPQHYNYDMWEGIEYTFDLTKPIGERLVHLNYHSQPVKAENQYDVVMNHYRAGGGGNYSMYQGKEIIQDIPIDMTEVLANYILENKKIIATCNDNFKVLY
ncbi:bifunctional metallophosphatase/5'-nucleotidase [Saliterribacillus persicus]|uniref:2',3'-cyclic-nucleotide 2'-phosphodiesterase/3'-nucleotidase n=1 Tax=Saliterribacillus persicus TaxID=930114 RepID=A0A368X965_9BACI|nr:bifunctional UDP-sugar hydrolase/5'-nucleotidase [Saliterribacillus persicus]RCW64269.1 2',3'-cyclic-nucleotide 2'-phosphodiesterase/3'-nucleotidase [Saliterribacillus persicus]